MKKIGNLVSPIIKELGLNDALALEALKKEWQNIFREPLSLHMSPLHLKNGELLITVDSPIWLQQLSFLKAEVVKNLGSFAVKNVRFRIGKVIPSHEKARIAKQKTEKRILGRDTIRHIDDTVSKIEDCALKEGIRKAMEKSFAAEKTKS